jgi:hypothetical protein
MTYDIVVVPDAIPETMPVNPIVATEGTVLLHVPPKVASAKGVVVPTQTVEDPVILAGVALTVTGVTA